MASTNQTPLQRKLTMERMNVFHAMDNGWLNKAYDDAMVKLSVQKAITSTGATCFEGPLEHPLQGDERYTIGCDMSLPVLDEDDIAVELQKDQHQVNCLLDDMLELMDEKEEFKPAQTSSPTKHSSADDSHCTLPSPLPITFAPQKNKREVKKRACKKRKMNFAM